MTAAASGCVANCHPPATLRRTMPASRSSYRRASSSQSSSASRRSISSASAMATAVTGSSETNNNASSRRSGSVRSSGMQSFPLPADDDLTERLRLREIHLPLSIQVEQRQEPNDDLDPLLAVGDQIPEGSLPELAETRTHRVERLRHRVADRCDVPEVKERRRAQDDGGGLRQVVGRDALQNVGIQVCEIRRGARFAPEQPGLLLGAALHFRGDATKCGELE